MKKVFLGSLSFFVVLSFIFVSVSGVYADENSAPQIASEYISEDMYDNFENDSENTAIPTVAEASGISVSAKSAVLIEASTGSILWEKEGDLQLAPASVTKIMTMLLLVEAIDDGKINLSDRVTTSEHANSMGGSQIWLKVGEEMTVDELLKAVAVGSANDASTALAEYISGSEEAFVDHMNRRASELGMKNTHFVNCCGLDADGHYSSAHDIGIMSAQLLKHELIKEYTTIWMDYLRDGATQLVNTNKLVRFYDGATGLKTGTTDSAGCCVSACAERNGLELIAVVMNSPSSNERFSDARTLLDYGFANYELCRVNLDDVDLGEIKVQHGVKSSVIIETPQPPQFLVEKAKGEQIKLKTSLPECVEAPVTAGQLLGKISYTLNDEVIGETRLLSSDSVERMTFANALLRLLERLISL